MERHLGGCHCGRVAFEIDATIDEFTTCDCSLCKMRNAVMVKVHESQLNVIDGQDRLTLYRWNTNVAQHYFCSDCGIYLFHRKRALPDHFGVNVFCLRDFDVDSVPIRPTDGKDMSVEAPDPQSHWPGPRTAS